MIVYGTSKTGRIYRNVQPLAIAQEPEVTRVCRLCGKEKPMTAYAKAKKLKSGRVYECKECVKAVHPNGKPVTIKDLETGEKTSYPSATKAAEDIGCSKSMILERVKGKRTSPVRRRYEVMVIEAEGKDV